jgi:nucleotide-binding universal stress UspA family protein
MAFKDILLALTTYPDATPASAIDQPIAFAASVGARISAIACAVHYQVPNSILGRALIDVPGMAAAEAKKSAAAAEQLLAAFSAQAEKQGVFQDKIAERCLTTEPPNILVEYARLRDLTIVPVPDGDSLQHSYAEAVIFGSGRPVLITSEERGHSDEFKLNTVVVAWDFSRPAARAVADALPVLEKAKLVRIVTVTKEKLIDTKRSSEELAKHLAHHGVEVVLDKVDAGGRSIGSVLEGYVASTNANLLVMGAYGHSRVREFILGGATKSILSRPPVPVLLSH